MNIENFFISILIGQKIYIIDDNYQLLNIMMFLFKLFPKELYFLLEFVINSNSLSNRNLSIIMSVKCSTSYCLSKQFIR